MASAANRRLVGFRPIVLFKSSDFNDLPTKLSPHGGTVGMARNSRLRHAEGPTDGHVRATVTLRRWRVQSRLRRILSVTEMFQQSDRTAVRIEDVRTQKPTLRITKWLRSRRRPIPFEAECSACPDAQFKIKYDKRSEGPNHGFYAPYGPPDRDRYMGAKEQV
jgi:hypothetical protein